MVPLERDIWEDQSIAFTVFGITFFFPSADNATLMHTLHLFSYSLPVQPCRVPSMMPLSNVGI